MAKKVGRPPKTRTFQDALLEIITSNLNKEEIFKRSSAVVMGTCTDAVLKAVKQFEPIILNALNEFENKGKGIEWLPTGTRFIHTDKDVRVYFIEQKPQVRTFRFNTECDINMHGKPTYRLALPYVVFMPVFLGDTYKISFIAYRNSALSSTNDELCFVNLPNCGQIEFKFDILSLYACVGTNRHGYHGFKFEGTARAEQCEELSEHFYNSEFNHDLPILFEYGVRLSNKLGSLNLWEKNSLADPSFMLNINWRRAGTVKDLTDYARRLCDSDSAVPTQLPQMGSLYSSAWNTAMNQAMEQRPHVANFMASELEKALRKFSVELQKGLMCIDNDTVRRTVQLAVAKAMVECAR